MNVAEQTIANFLALAHLTRHNRTITANASFRAAADACRGGVRFESVDFATSWSEGESSVIVTIQRGVHTEPLPPAEIHRFTKADILGE
jgi:hypothetical protein